MNRIEARRGWTVISAAPDFIIYCRFFGISVGTIKPSTVVEDSRVVVAEVERIFDLEFARPNPVVVALADGIGDGRKPA